MNGGGWRWVLAAPCTENGGLDVFSVGCTTRWLKKTASVGGLDTVTLIMMSAHNHLQMRETGRLEIKLLSGVAQAQDGCKCCEQYRDNSCFAGFNDGISCLHAS